jgi:hypothetical protein
VIRSADLKQVTCRLPTHSTVMDHGGTCCRDALAWLQGMDAANSYFEGKWLIPTWLRREFDWGPMRWPCYWCDIPESKTLDCGALAAIAVQLYRFRATPAAQVQLVFRYPQHVADQWLGMWTRAGQKAHWIAGNYCYHEGCGVLEGRRLSVWDPTWSRWCEPPLSPHEAFASVVALKVSEVRAIEPLDVEWEAIAVRIGVWNMLSIDHRGCVTATHE